jgi:hypothetical protein
VQISTSIQREPDPLARNRVRDIDFHLLLKVRSGGGETISAHTEMINRRGSALFGKMGSALGNNFQKALNDQISRNVRTYLFLATLQGNTGQHAIYQCPLIAVHDGMLDSRQEELVPEYYSYQIDGIWTWFEIAGIELLTPAEANAIFVLSSGRKFLDVIRARNAVFRVGINRQMTRGQQREL